MDTPLLPMQTPVRIPGRNLLGRITGYERIDGEFRHYAVECHPTRQKPMTTVWFVRPEEVEVVAAVPMTHGKTGT